MKQLQLITSQITMSSLEIADLTGKLHKNILADIRKMLGELHIDSAEFSAQYIDDTGKANIMFELPRREIDILISGYNIKYRAAIIDRMYTLEQENTQLLKQQVELLKLQASIAKYKTTIEKANTDIVKHQTTRKVLEAKTTQLLAQGAKVKGDMSASKLSMPVDTITNLLLAHGSNLTPAEANNTLVRLGYLSPDKTSVTDTGSYYGRTIKPSPKAKTSVARWFTSEFPQLLPILIANK